MRGTVRSGLFSNDGIVLAGLGISWSCYVLRSTISLSYYRLNNNSMPGVIFVGLNSEAPNHNHIQTLSFPFASSSTLAAITCLPHLGPAL